MRFVHTADWQLGMTRHFLSPEAQARFSEARLDAVRAIGRLATEQNCEFVVVCGDVFESNHLDRRLLRRTFEALADFKVPVLLLPGNHDPFDAASIYRAGEFVAQRPDHVRVLSACAPYPVADGVEVIAAPWDSKRPLNDLVSAACAAISPDPRVLRIVAGHGIVDALSPDPTNPALIMMDGVAAALADGRIQYVALGDRHSLTQVGQSGRVWYAGTPEVTDYDEVKPGYVLVVDLRQDGVDVQQHSVGTWRFVQREVPLSGDADLDDFERWLGDQPNKERAVLKLGFKGTLSIRTKARLDEMLERFADVFAAIQVSDRRSDLAVLPSDADLGALDLTGFAASAQQELTSRATGGGPEGETAQNALALLYRLGGGVA
jgi:DNA repair exonuclease SbcCD nuclease subunit